LLEPPPVAPGFSETAIPVDKTDPMEKVMSSNTSIELDASNESWFFTSALFSFLTSYNVTELLRLLTRPVANKSLGQVKPAVLIPNS